MEQLLTLLAEKEGFEPPVRRTDNGFQDRRIRPLCHFSVGKSSIYFFFCKNILRKYNILFYPRPNKVYKRCELSYDFRKCRDNY